MSAGGIFLSYNKVLPGAYINFVSKSRALAQLSDTGIVAFAMKNNWGIENKVISISSEDFQKNSLKIFGYPYESLELKPIREIFKNAKELKFFRLGSGTKANATIEALNITALHNGTRGNDIKIKISKNIDSSNFTVFTFFDEILVDEQTVSDISNLKHNDFVSFSGNGTISNNNAGTKLSNGSDSEATNIEYTNFLNCIEAEVFNVLLYDGDDEINKSLFTSFTKRLRDEEGIKFLTVLHDFAKADYEGVVSLKNEKFLLYWLSGAIASAQINESITNKVYDGEYDFDAKFSNSDLKKSIQNGEITFYQDATDKKILKDINTFTSFSPDKNSDFSNNQIIRVLDSTANDIARIFNDYYLGKMQNDEIGRDIFKSEVIQYFKQLQSLRAIDNFDENDIVILKGNQKGDVIIHILIEPIACMEKLYMKCIIE